MLLPGTNSWINGRINSFSSLVCLLFSSYCQNLFCFFKLYPNTSLLRQKPVAESLRHPETNFIQLKNLKTTDLHFLKDLSRDLSY